MAEQNHLAYTGERLVTQKISDDTVYHLHRYAVTLSYIKNQVVVDIASGEGYGSNIMAKHAQTVFGIDIAEDAVNFANQKYQKTKNLSFKVGAAEQIPLADGIADVVVSFETLEHTSKHHEMLSEIKRVLKPDGLLIMSSPDKANYSDRFNRINEFHVKELYLSEFKSLINQYFSCTSFYYQTFLTGSFICKENFSTGTIKEYQGNYNEIHLEPTLQFPLFNIVVAANVPFKEPDASYFDGTEVMRQMYYDIAKTFTPYKIGNLLLKPFRFLFKRK